MNADPVTELPRRRVVRFTSLLLIAAATVVTGALLYRFNPMEHGFYPRCMFHTVTGLQCPGCGGLRATHQLLHGNIRAAFALNPFLVVALPFAAVWIGHRWVAHRAGRDDWNQNTSRKLWLLAAVVVLFGVFRNLPWAAWLK